MSDELIWVNLEDREVGHGEKLATHQARRLHRAFSVFLVDGDRMLLQRRAQGKYHSGGLWCNACCSHPRLGETLPTAVERRLETELGIPPGDCAVEELFSFVYHQDYGQLSEYELDHVFLGQYAGALDPDPQEIQGLRWIPLPALEEELLANPRSFSAWFLIAAPRVLAHLNKGKNVQGTCMR